MGKLCRIKLMRENCSEPEKRDGPIARPSLLISGWALAIVAGSLALSFYETRPGLGAHASSNLRPTSVTASNMKLVVFLHPRCPCGVATVHELSRLMSECGDRLSTEVEILQPTDRPPSWGQTQLVQDVRAIPGVTVAFDRDGKLAEKLGVSTSGQVMLYDGAGTLLFGGGITASRGHVGDNDGVDAVVAWVRSNGGPTALRTPVFGCSLLGCRRADQK